MKKLVLTLLCVAVLVSSAFATVKPVRLEGNKIVVSATRKESATLVYYVQEAKHVDRNTTKGNIFWKRETFQFPSEGLYEIEVDLKKAKADKRYCVVVVNHTEGTKHRLYATIVNGKFKPE
jgi:hypothetical protein